MAEISMKYLERMFDRLREARQIDRDDPPQVGEISDATAMILGSIKDYLATHQAPKRD